MKFIVSILLSGLFFLIPPGIQAQTTITGKVIDAETKSPLPYASIRIKEKALGVITNERGDFTLTLNSSPDTYTLVISFIGFKTFEINLTEFIGRTDKVIRLEPTVRELESVTISEKKFDVDEFMTQVRTAYQANARKTPHIAQAYFQEQISIKAKPVFFAEGIGYSVYMGDTGNEAARSNYKFFYEKVSVNRNLKPYTDQITKPGKTDTHRFGGSDNLNNFRSAELNGPLSTTGKKFKYELANKSAAQYQGKASLTVNFKGSGQSGWMIIEEENLNVRVIAFNTSENIWSSIYDERVDGTFLCIYDYYENQPYLAEAHSFYTKGNTIHRNKLKIVSQKFDKLELSDEEYWMINSLDRFMLNQGKEIDAQVESYRFSIEDPVQQSEFKEGFNVQVIDPEKNPGYQELLIKLRAFF